MEVDLNSVLPILTTIITAVPVAIASVLATRSKYQKELEEARGEYHKKLITQNHELQTQIDSMRTQHKMEISELRVENSERKAAEHKCERNLLLLKNALAEAGILTKYQMENYSAIHDQRQKRLQERGQLGEDQKARKG
jgi:hypothetical protein